MDRINLISIENYKIIKNKIEIDSFDPIIIFGSNGSGKTTIVESIQYFLNICLYDYFAIIIDNKNKDIIINEKPTNFAIHFTYSNQDYFYEIQVFANHIGFEQLTNETNNQIIFERSTKEIRSLMRTHPLCEYLKTIQIFNSDNNFSIADINKYYSELEVIFKCLGISLNQKLLSEIYKSEQYSKLKKIIQVYITLKDALSNHNFLIIDDFDLGLDTNLIKSFISMFKSNNNQLMFTSGNTSLLDEKLFMKHQIYLLENINNEMDLFTLNEFIDLPNGISFEKWYLTGRFGALPLFNLEDLSK